MNKNWTFGQKLAGGYAIMVLLALVISLVAIYALRAVVAGKDHVISNNAQVLIEVGKLHTISVKRIAAVRGYVILPDERFLAQLRTSREDFTETARGYDLLFDCVGNRSMFACRRVLKPGGRCVIIGAPDSRWLAGIMVRPLEALLLSPFGSRKFIVFIARLNREDLTLLGELMASGKLTPVIDRRYPLVEAAEALRYLEGKHARGKVVITVSP